MSAPDEIPALDARDRAIAAAARAWLSGPDPAELVRVLETLTRIDPDDADLAAALDRFRSCASFLTLARVGELISLKAHYIERIVPNANGAPSP